MSEVTEISVKLSGIEAYNAALQRANYHAQKLKDSLTEIDKLRKDIKIIEK